MLSRALTLSLFLFCSSSVLAGDLLPDLPSIGSLQSAAVKGVLKCNGKPAVGVKVKLYDEDRTDLDDLMAEGVSDKNGTFLLKGHETEITSIDPKVNVYHKCGWDGPCYQKFSIGVPDEYITEGGDPKKIFDVGELNLNGEFSGQSTDCLN